MRLVNTSRQGSTDNNNDKALITRCTKIQRTCTTLQGELDDGLARHGIRKAEFNELSGRLKKMDRAASGVLKQVRA